MNTLIDIITGGGAKIVAIVAVVFGALFAAWRSGRVSAENAQAKKNAKAAEKAREIDRDTAGQSATEIDREAGKWTRN